MDLLVSTFLLCDTVILLRVTVGCNRIFVGFWDGRQAHIVCCTAIIYLLFTLFCFLPLYFALHTRESIDKTEKH